MQRPVNLKKDALKKFIELIASEENTMKYLWRLVIDGKNQFRNDPYIFDKPRPGCPGEPGYLQSMLKAMHHILSTLHEPLTTASIEELHDLAIEAVIFSSDPDKSRKGIRTREVFFDLTSSNLSFAGLEEIVRYDDALSGICSRNNVSKNNLPAPTLEEIYTDAKQNKRTYARCDVFLETGEALKSYLIAELQQLINIYYEEIKLAQQNEEEIIRAIVKFAHKADILHPFIDGNVRTFVFLTVNKLLLQNGLFPAIFEDPNRFDGFSITELVTEVYTGQNTWILMAAKEGYVDLMKLLLEIGYDPNVIDRNGYSPFLIACEYGHLEIVRLLISHGTDLSHLSTNGNSALLLATNYRYRDLDLIKTLIDAGANPNCSNSTGLTPLIIAVCFNHIEITIMLLKAGASPNQCDREGRPLLSVAIEKNYQEIIAELLKYGANPAMLFDKKAPIKTEPLLKKIGLFSKSLFISALKKETINLLDQLYSENDALNDRDISEFRNQSLVALDAIEKDYDITKVDNLVNFIKNLREIKLTLNIKVKSGKQTINKKTY